MNFSWSKELRVGIGYLSFSFLVLKVGVPVKNSMSQITSRGYLSWRLELLAGHMYGIRRVIFPHTPAQVDFNFRLYKIFRQKNVQNSPFPLLQVQDQPLRRMAFPFWAQLIVTIWTIGRCTLCFQFLALFQQNYLSLQARYLSHCAYFLLLLVCLFLNRASVDIYEICLARMKQHFGVSDSAEDWER